jgi:DHA2 family lincomycin resistance protein-like MFS transporter
MTDTASLPAVSSEVDAAATSKRNTLVITLLLISAFVVILNETIMGVAIPRLMEDLRIEASAAQWLSTAFMLTMAVVIPITGFLLQRYNTRPVFIAAMTLFSIGTLIAAIAPGFAILLVGRVVQASGTAIMMPLLFTTVLNLVPPASRGRVIGNISIVISVAPAIGPTISGVILHYLDWRWMFILVLPIALAALTIGARKMVNVTEPTTANIDVLSVILAAFGFGGLVFGLSNFGDPWFGTLPLAVGAIALGLFIWRQLLLQRSDAALLDLRTFSSGTFTVSIVTVGVSMIALFGTIILLPIYTQTVLGLDALETGLMLLPGGLLMGLLAPLVGRIYDARGPRLLLIPGAIIVSGSLWGMTMLDATSPVWAVVTAHVVLSLGLALLFTPLFTAGLASLTPKLYSHGSAIVGTVQQLAGAAGTALFVTVMTLTALRASGGDLPSAVDTAEGIRTAFTYGAIISLFAIPAVFFIKRPAEDPNAEWAPAGH